MTAPDPAHSLGSYMRTVAEHLHSDATMSFEDAHKLIPSMDLGYAAAVLIRLEARGVSRQTNTGTYLYIRGPRWHDAAAHYKWVDNET